MTSIFWDSQGVTMIDYLEQGRTINRNRKKEARKTDSRCSDLGGQRHAHTSQIAMTAVSECSPKYKGPRTF